MIIGAAVGGVALVGVAAAAYFMCGASSAKAPDAPKRKGDLEQDAYAV